MKTTITRAEYLQLLGLATLTGQASRKCREYFDAAQAMLEATAEPVVGSPFGHVEDFLYQGSEGDYTDTALSEALRRAGIMVIEADPAAVVGSP